MKPIIPQLAVIALQLSLFPAVMSIHSRPMARIKLSVISAGSICLKFSIIYLFLFVIPTCYKNNILFLKSDRRIAHPD